MELGFFSNFENRREQNTREYSINSSNDKSNERSIYSILKEKDNKYTCAKEITK